MSKEQIAKILIGYTKRNHIMASTVILNDYAEVIYNEYFKKIKLTPCDVCKFNPPTSGDNKPCFICPAQAKGADNE